MSFQVEIAGKSADRYRAYGAVKLLRKPTAKDHAKRALDGKPEFGKDDRIRYDGEDVVASGEVTGESLKISGDAGALTRVVFYKGPVSAESVVGSVDIDASGDIAIEIVEPAAPTGAASKAVIVDE